MNDAAGAPASHALLTDGTTVLIRPTRPDDQRAVRALFAQMSRENLRLRFFSDSPEAGRQTARRVCAPPRVGQRALVALLGDRVIGVAEYQADQPASQHGEPGRPRSAELALAVADDFHDRGLGTLLVEHLVHAARGDGITEFTAEALADNRAMLKVFADLGLNTRRRFAGTEVRCTVRLAPDERYRTAVDERGRTADTASLRPLLRARSVVVVGAGTRPGSVGRAVLRNLRRGHFGGQLHAVNPHAHSIERTPTVPSIDALPHIPDLAVVTVPAAAVAEVARSCGDHGVPALVVLTSGLDAEQAAALLANCRAAGIRLVGPNCLGIANTEPGVSLNATFAPPRLSATAPEVVCPQPGTAGVAVQSGGVGIALLGGLTHLGIGVSSFVSLGDKYDVSGNDLLQWWESDGRTRLALLHLESFGNPRAFSRTARRVARRMPILTVDAGRSRAGRRAAASHTAAAASPTMTRQALFTQAGIIATRSIAELLDTAALLHAQPLPADASVALVSNAGGAGVLAADACVEAGLRVPSPPADLVARLTAVLPDGSSIANPVDTTAAATTEELRACVDALAADGFADAVLVVLVPTALTAGTEDDPVRALPRVVSGQRRRPVAAVLLDQSERVRLLTIEEGRTLPAYADPQSAAHALAHAARYARWLSSPPGTAAELTDVDPDGAAELVTGFLARYPAGGWLDPQRCADLLDRYRIPRLPQWWARDEQEAVDAAARLVHPGGRVVLKGYGPGLLHKSERGAVILDLAGEAQVRAAHRELTARLGDALDGVLVQPMADRGVELVAGVVQDEVFGPLVLFGLGGTATELLADHAARLAPLTDRDIHDLINAPRGAPLLFGYRGSAPVDLGALEGVLARLSALACDLPQLAEAELNPLVARPDGVIAVDVRLRVLPRAAHDPYLRRLR